MNLRFQPCVIAGENGLLNGNRREWRDQVLQPLQDLLVIHQRNLPVGQGNLAHKIAAEGGRGFQCLQIAGHQQEAVNGGWIALDLRVDHTGVNADRESVISELKKYNCPNTIVNGLAGSSNLVILYFSHFPFSNLVIELHVRISYNNL